MIKKKTEIKKLTKISLVVIGIVTFMFGILLIFLLDIFLTPLTGWTNPMHPRSFGGICLLSAIFAVILLRKKEWEEIKLLYAFIVSMFIPSITIELYVLVVYGSTFSAAAISQVFLDQILMFVMLALGVISYYKQEH